MGFWDEAPDLCIEIISPSEERQEMARKVREYFESGAREVWHLFPETRTLRRFTSPIEWDDLFTESEISLPNLLPTFHATVSELFEID